MDGESREVPMTGHSESVRVNGAVLAQNVQISGGIFTSAGRDVNNHLHTHYHLKPSTEEAPTVDVLAALRKVSNQRQIHQDTLAKATPKTGEWILEYDMFLTWQDPTSDLRMICGSGMPGAGKTVLTSIVMNIVEKCGRERGSPICVGFIYIRYSDNTGLTVRDCLETLVKQSVEQHSSCLQLAQAVYARHVHLETKPTEGELLQLLQSFTKVVVSTTYFLDALDEAPPSIQIDLVQKLSSTDAKLFITSRPMKALEESFPNARHFSIAAQESDLDLHINSKLNSSQELSKVLEQGGAKWRAYIVATIKQKCGGMFLHASLQLAALQDCTSVYDVKETLANFPPNIEDVYHHTWTRIVNQSSKKGIVAQNCLIWVLNAPKSMTLAQLQYATAVCLETHKFKRERVVHKNTLVAICCGLLVLDEKTALVRLVHYTAKETLQRLILEAFPRLHSLMALLCMGRLTRRGFQNWSDSQRHSLKRAMETDPLLPYAYYAWATHARHSLDEHSTAAKVNEFVRGCKSFPADCPHSELDLLGPLHVVAFFNLPISLAGGDWMNTLNSNSRTCQRDTPLHLASRHTSDFTAMKELLSLWLVDVNATNKSEQTPLISASRRGNVGAAKLLLDHPKIKLNLTDEEGMTAFTAAISEGNEGLVKVMLAHSPGEIHSADGRGRTALMLACHRGDSTMVKLLLAHSHSEVGSVDNDGRTPLSRAVSSRCIDTFKLILSQSCQDVVNLADKEGRTPLSWASSGGREEAVNILLAYPGTDVNQVDSHGFTPLGRALALYETRVAAARIGWTALVSAAPDQDAVMRVLLAHPKTSVNVRNHVGLTLLMQVTRSCTLQLLLAHPMIDVNLPDDEGQTPLHHLVTSERNSNKIKLLLAHPNVDVNVQDNMGRTPLNRALERSKKATKLLLAHAQTNVDLPDNEGQTPLHRLVTSWGANDKFTRLLGHPDIAVNSQDNTGRTPLSRASESNPEAAQLLLAHPRIQVNLPDNEGRTPLIWFVMRKHLPDGQGYHKHFATLLRALLAHPEMDVNLADNAGRTALTWASKQGDTECAELLLKHPQLRPCFRVDDLDHTCSTSAPTGDVWWY